MAAAATPDRKKRRKPPLPPRHAALNRSIQVQRFAVVREDIDPRAGALVVLAAEEQQFALIR